MRAPTEILGIRYFLLGVIFTRTDTRVESSHQGTPQDQNKSFSFHFQTARAFGPGLNLLFWGLPVPLGQTSTFTHYTTQGIRLLVPSGLGLFLIISRCCTTLSCLQCLAHEAFAASDWCWNFVTDF